jgi:transcriptional regulator with XRE-family HTH domain
MCKTIIPNRLWMYRKKNGLSQKRVAFFLRQITSSQISHYERGAKYPNLKNALMLEIIYHVPVAFLFRDLYKKLQAEISTRGRALRKMLEQE